MKPNCYQCKYRGDIPGDAHSALLPCLPRIRGCGKRCAASVKWLATMLSAYSTDKEHILEFVKFLRECGGSFEIC